MTRNTATVRCITMGATHTGEVVEVRPWRTLTGRLSTRYAQLVIRDDVTGRLVCGEPSLRDEITGRPSLDLDQF